MCVCHCRLQAICLLVKEKLSKEALEKKEKERGTKVKRCKGFLANVLPWFVLTVVNVNTW